MADITVEQLKERLDAGEKVNLIDVRETYEHEEFNVGGQLIPLGNIPMELSNLDGMKGEEVIVYCRSGKRSGMAQELLTRAGFTNVRNLIGGMMEWTSKF